MKYQIARHCQKTFESAHCCLNITMQWWLRCVVVPLLLSSSCPRQVMVCHSPVSHLSALWGYLWIFYSTPLSLEAAADPDHFFLGAFFQAQNWNSFTSACSVEAKDEVTEVWHPSGRSVWFPTHLLSRLLGLVWEPSLTGSSSAMTMTYRISFTFISQALGGKLRAKTDRYLERVPDLWEGWGRRLLQVFFTWEEIEYVLYPVHVFFTNVLMLSNYNHP